MNDWASTHRRTQVLSADAAGIAEAVRLLEAGGLVALPTETVYGLAADATEARAVAGIYAAKGRPQFNPLIAHLLDFAHARGHGLFDAPALALAKAFWPGPLTLVVPLNPSSAICDLARAGLSSVGLRVPAETATRAVLEALGRPLAMPSANRSGHVSPTSAAHVLADLEGRIDAVLDGGASPVGVESTIVACVGGAPRLLRPGGIARARVEAVIGRAVVDGSHDGVIAQNSVIAPGMLASHYAPNARLRLDAQAPLAGEAWLGFGPHPVAAEPGENLSPTGDLVEAAANLFAMLRRLDATGATAIAVARIPADGLGEAIRDRLARAAVR